MKLKTSKKKLKAGWILFIIGAIAFAAVIVQFCMGDVPFFKDNVWILPVSLVLYMVCVGVSLYLNWSFRKNSIAAGASSTTLYVFQWIFYAPLMLFMVIMFVVCLFCGVSIPIFGGNKEKVVKVKDENGNQYELSPTYADRFDGGDEYEDQNGDLWETWDGGQTFERTKRITPVYINDSEGKKLKLTPTFRGSERYLDENGDEWWTLDGGKTFERVPKK